MKEIKYKVPMINSENKVKYKEIEGFYLGFLSRKHNRKLAKNKHREIVCTSDKYSLIDTITITDIKTGICVHVSSAKHMHKKIKELVSRADKTVKLVGLNNEEGNNAKIK